MAPGAGWHGGAMRQSDIHRDPAHIVIAGGGVAALETLIALRAMAPGDCRGDGRLGQRHIQLPPAPGRRAVRPRSAASATRSPSSAVTWAPHFVHDRLVSRRRRRARARDCAITGGSPTTSSCWRSAPTRSPHPSTASTFDRETVPEDFDEVLSASGEGLAEHLAIVVPTARAGRCLPMSSRC